MIGTLKHVWRLGVEREPVVVVSCILGAVGTWLVGGVVSRGSELTQDRQKRTGCALPLIVPPMLGDKKKEAANKPSQ